MSELGIYEGCYVELKDNSVEGPLTNAKWSKNFPWRFAKKGYVECWKVTGEHHESKLCNIVRVLTLAEVAEHTGKHPFAKPEPIEPAVATIPPHVLSAAMGAGIKVEPAYEQFVSAILEAGFRAQYGIEFVPVGKKPVVEITDELLEQIASVFGDKGFYEWSDVGQSKMRGAAECVIAFCGRSADPKNESANRIQDSERAKGGLSKLPSVADINEAIILAVKHWNEHHDPTSAPPTFAIAKRVQNMLAERFRDDF